MIPDADGLQAVVVLTITMGWLKPDALLLPPAVAISDLFTVDMIAKYIEGKLSAKV